MSWGSVQASSFGVWTGMCSGAWESFSSAVSFVAGTPVTVSCTIGRLRPRRGVGPRGVLCRVALGRLLIVRRGMSLPVYRIQLHPVLAASAAAASECVEGRGRVVLLLCVCTSCVARQGFCWVPLCGIASRWPLGEGMGDALCARALLF